MAKTARVRVKADYYDNQLGKLMTTLVKDNFGNELPNIFEVDVKRAEVLAQANVVEILSVSKEKEQKEIKIEPKVEKISEEKEEKEVKQEKPLKNFKKLSK